MTSQISPKLLAEYRDPLPSLDQKTYVAMRKEQIRRALIITALGFFFLVLTLWPDHTDARSPAMIKGNFATVVLAVTLFPYGLYKLATVRRSLAAIRRDQLVWLRPELRALRPIRKARKLPALGTRILVYFIVVSLAVIAMTVWALSL